MQRSIGAGERGAVREKTHRTLDTAYCTMYTARCTLECPKRGTQVRLKMHKDDVQRSKMHVPPPLPPCILRRILGRGSAAVDPTWTGVNRHGMDPVPFPPSAPQFARDMRFPVGKECREPAARNCVVASAEPRGPFLPEYLDVWDLFQGRFFQLFQSR